MIYRWLKDTEFAYPYVLGLLVVLPFLAWWYIRNNNRSQASFRVSAAYAFTISTWKNRFRHLPFILRLLALGCLVVAMARPQKKHAEQRSEGEGIDIILCMDVSGSMNTRDILPSRMEVARQVAEEFVRGRPVDRIGLVVFSGESFTQCPITTDRNMLISQIQAIGNNSYLASGTVIGEGLATAVDRLSKSGGKSKVIILLTDGKEDPSDTRLLDPLTALEIAKSRGVKVYTIGMSAGPSAGTENIVREKTGNQPTSDFLDEALLQKIAGETGGRYYRARDRDALQAIYRQIDELEKTKIEVISFERFEERFLPFILAALGLLFAETGLRFTLLRKFP